VFYLASDHAGFALKEKLKQVLIDYKIKFEDLGTNSLEKSVDYPDFAHKLAKKISENLTQNRGIGICGTGIGISIALNRHRKIRAARCLSVEDAELTRKHNNANVLVLAGRKTTPKLARQILRKFLEIKFEGGRHKKRVSKIEI